MDNVLENFPPLCKETVVAQLISFAELMERVRAGNQEAAAELVRRYEPAIRRVARYRLHDTHMEGALESMDICQSVMASFFVRAAFGQFDLEQPEQLQKLLLAMARNKVAFHQRLRMAQRRDQRRLEGGLDEGALAAPGSSPSRQVAAKELLEEVRRRLSPEERQMVELRDQGLDWKQIAQRLGGSAEALRKQLARAVDRIAQDMGMDDWVQK
jgi:RNA polymerase sigma factor (sigma-70 family)